MGGRINTSGRTPTPHVGRTAFERVAVVYPDPALPVVAYSGRYGRIARFHVHTEDDWELCYIANGEADYRVGKKKFMLRPGEMLVVGPDLPHACLQWHGERFVVIFRRWFLRKTGLMVSCSRKGELAVNGVHFAPRLRLVPWRRTAVEHLFDRLRQESFGNQPEKSRMCAALLAQLLLELARNEKDRAAAGSTPIESSIVSVVEQTCAAVRKNLERPWTLAAMVKCSGYSATQLGVFFRQVTGLSPCHWLAQERIHQTCRALVHTEQTVTQIASDAGFGSRSQFYRLFRKTTGSTPERYRSILRHEEQA